MCVRIKSWETFVAEEDMEVYKVVTEEKGVLFSCVPVDERATQDGFKDKGVESVYEFGKAITSPFPHTPGFYSFLNARDAFYYRDYVREVDEATDGNVRFRVIKAIVPKGTLIRKAFSLFGHDLENWNCVLSEVLIPVD